MAQSYTRQSTFADGDTITASLFNNEYNQLINTFAYSSVDVGATGHRHDGSSAQGGNIHTIGDLDFFNKIVVDSTNNRWGVFVQVGAGAVEQIRIQDGGIVPVTTNDIDLGTASLQFKDIFIDGTANIDSLVLTSGSTVTTILDEDDLVSNSATALVTQQSVKAYIDAQVTAQDLDIVGDTGTDSIDLDSETITFTGGTGITSVVTTGVVTHNIDSTVATLTGTQTLTNKTITSPDINGGTIDEADITVGVGKTFDVSAGTLTLADNQISGDKVEGGTIAATTITDLTFGSLNDGAITVTAWVDEDSMVSNSATLVPTQQSVKAYVDSQVTAQDLDIIGDTGTDAIDLDSETLTFTGGTGITSVVTAGTVTHSIDSTVATLTGIQTLTNKTLTAPVISGNLTTDGNIDGRDVATDGAKLDSIESGATADQTDAEIRAAVEAAIDSNVFTDADHTKLDGIEAGATADQTDAEIRAAVEAATDSNVFTDADHTKLNGIEDNATADQTDAEIRAAVEAATDSNVFTDADHTKLDGIEALADVTDTANVTAAGALMDSELTDITAVKALDQGVATTDSPTFVNMTMTGTGSVKVPAGTTGERDGSPVNGMFRYNSTNEQFEGYQNSEWGSIGGGGGSNTFTTDTFTGDGATTDYALSQVINSEDNLMVFIAGVFQQQSSYSIATASGITTLTFSVAPVNTREIVIYSIAGAVSGTNLNIDSMTGDGATDSLELSIVPVNENNTQVFIDGVYQSKANYSVSGTTLTFSTAPPTGTAVEVMTMNQTDINVPVDGTITSAKLDTNIAIAGTLDVGGVGTFSDNVTLLKTTADANLEVQTTFAGADARLSLYGNSTGTSQIRFGDEASVNVGLLTYNHTDDSLTARVGGSDALTIDASGNLGIGVTPETWQSTYDVLQIGAAGSITASNTNPSRTYVNANIYQNASNVASYIATDEASQYFQNGGTHIFNVAPSGTAGSAINWTTAMTIDNSGNLDIGSPYPITGLRGARRLVLNDTDQGVDFVAYSSTNGIVADQYIGGYLFGNDDNNVTEDHFAGMWANSEGTGGSMTLRFAAGKANYETDTPQMMIDGLGNVLVGKTTTAFGTVGIRLEGPNGKIEATRSNNIVMDLNRLSGDGPIAYFSKDGATVGSISSAATGGGSLVIGNASSGIMFRTDLTGSAFIPANPTTGAQVDNGLDVGHPVIRFDDIYATNGTIQTSDRNEKQDIEELSAAETAVAVACKGLLRKFRWIDSVEEKGDDARIHFGIIAQDLQDAFTAEGLDAGRYAMFISSTWWETQTEVEAVEAVEFVQAVEAVYDEDGELVSEAVEGVEAVEAKDAYIRTDTFATLEEAPEGATERTRLGVRYPELLAFIIAAI